jgi:hypothetical protein
MIRRVKETLYEKFTEDSDPIHDMDIGSISFEEKAKATIRDGTEGGREKWLRYLNSFKGKYITGYFRKQGDRLIGNSYGYLTIKIKEFDSYSLGSDLYVVDENGKVYAIDSNERYIIN